MINKVVIFGAGTVGSSVAEALASEEHDVTLVDQDSVVLDRINQRIDIRTIIGNACDPKVLDAADIKDAELVLAVTNDDNTNMLVCQLADMIGGYMPQSIARLRNPEFRKRGGELFGRDRDQIPFDQFIDLEELIKKLRKGEVDLFNLLGQRPYKIPIDVFINPEELVTELVIRLIRHPGAIQVVDLADEQIQLVGIKADEGGILVEHKIRELKIFLPQVETRVVAIYRKHEPVIPRADTVIQAGDEVFFIAAPEHISEIMTKFTSVRTSIGKRVMIAGAGNVGMQLASEIASTEFRVKLFEIDEVRAREVARLLSDTIVILGSATDPNLLARENIEATEMFCAVTNNDEVNLVSAMIAKKLGARRTMALISNTQYAELLDETGIDILISPNLSTVSEILRYVRLGATMAVHSLRRGIAEALEIKVLGTEQTSHIVGRTIKELQLPLGTSLEAVLRHNNQVLLANDELVIQSGDLAIVIVMHKDRKQIAYVEKLFEPSVLFMY